jgi:ABC-type sugar transport system ATPase subunit
MALLEVENLSYSQPGGFELFPFSFKQEEGLKIAIAGETGSGKTTILKLLAGLLDPRSGQIKMMGELVSGPSQNLIPGNPRIAYLSQYFELAKSLRVEQVLQYASKMSEMAAARIYRICEVTHLLQRRTDQLSGGEKQRIALARLLVMSPDLLLLDEPYSNLDAVHRLEMKSVVERVADQLGITSILVSHDSSDTLPWADELFVIQKGRIVQRAAPQVIYRRPVSEYVGALFGKYNLIPIDPANPGVKAFFRPDDFVITDSEDFEFEGTVSRISYNGPHYEIHISTPEVSIVTIVREPECQVGDRIRLRVLPERAHFINE